MREQASPRFSKFRRIGTRTERKSAGRYIKLPCLPAGQKETAEDAEKRRDTLSASSANSAVEFVVEDGVVPDESHRISIRRSLAIWVSVAAVVCSTWASLGGWPFGWQILNFAAIGGANLAIYFWWSVNPHWRRRLKGLIALEIGLFLLAGIVVLVVMNAGPESVARHIAIYAFVAITALATGFGMAFGISLPPAKSVEPPVPKPDGASGSN